VTQRFNESLRYHEIYTKIRQQFDEIRNYNYWEHEIKLIHDHTQRELRRRKNSNYLMSPRITS